MISTSSFILSPKKPFYFCFSGFTWIIYSVLPTVCAVTTYDVLWVSLHANELHQEQTFNIHTKVKSKSTYPKNL